MKRDTRWVALVSWFVLGLGCTALSDDNGAPAGDGAVPAMDAGPSDAGGRDAGGSAGSSPATKPDAGRESGVDDGEPDAPDSCTNMTFYADEDGDGYGDSASTKRACQAPDGYVDNRTDCDDTCKDCHPHGEEACNDQDDNCNGAIDEGCACELGATRPCGEERGVCMRGTQSCTDGAWSLSCEGGRGPEPSELCNDLDDDCNGVTDDGIAQLGDDCSVGVGECERPGTFVCGSDPSDPPQCDATAAAPGTEVCANDLDDDCDDKTDEAPSASTCCGDADCDSDQRCDGDSCVDKSWCELRTRPSGVVAADDQCLDFDRSASFSPWAATSGSGDQLQVSSAEAASAPSSLYTGTAGLATSKAMLSWSAVGATTVTSATLAASVRFPNQIGFHEYWLGADELLCIQNATTRYCVRYAYSEDHPAGWGLSLEEVQTTGVIETHVCQLLPPPEVNVWSRIELRVSSTSAPSVLLDGTPLSAPDCTFSLPTNTSVAFQVGMQQTAADEAWQLYFDDVVASAER